MLRQTCPLLIALAACGEISQPLDDAGAGADAAEDVDAAPPVPLISEALADECGDYTPASGVGAGNDLHRVTLTDPAAVCNDGTPAVMYIRPSIGGAQVNQWVFYLQGGSSCGTVEACTTRYCGTEKYTKAKMSSIWTPLAANTDGQGLLDRNGENPYGAANLVLLYYCSSDQWMGRRVDSVLVDPEDPSDTFRLHFRGHAIIEAALDRLLAGPVTSEDGLATVPSLDSATLVLWTGTSAGGNGAEQNLDYVAERLAPNGTQVRGVFDANLPPQPSDLGDETAEEVFEAYDRDVAWPEIQAGAWDAYVDQSCLAGHDAAEAWRCGQNEHVVLNHVVTPFFVRQDLHDRSAGGRYLEAGGTPAQVAEAFRRTLVRIPDIADHAEEAAAITVTPGVYGPNCGQHVALSNQVWFEEATVADVSFRGALSAWLLGQEVALVDSQPATASYCPEEVESGE
jgi:hypothetical protein